MQQYKMMSQQVTVECCDEVSINNKSQMSEQNRSIQNNSNRSHRSQNTHGEMSGSKRSDEHSMIMNEETQQPKNVDEKPIATNQLTFEELLETKL